MAVAKNVNGKVEIIKFDVLRKEDKWFTASWSIKNNCGIGVLPRRVFSLLSVVKNGEKTWLWQSSRVLRKGTVWEDLGYDGSTKVTKPYTIMVEAGILITRLGRVRITHDRETG